MIAHGNYFIFQIISDDLQPNSDLFLTNMNLK